MVENISVDRLVAAYIKMRDKRSVILRDYEEQDDAIKAQMELVETKLLDLCKTLDTDSLKTQHGLVYRSVKTRYWTSDWQSMYKFIKEHDMLELLEQRVSQSGMKQLLEENPDLMPRGMNIDSKYSVTIRRSKNAS